MILYQGLLRSPASWARVGRGYVGAFVKLGIDFAVLAPRGFRYDPAFAIPAGVREVSTGEAQSLPEPEVGLGFLHPPLVGRLLGHKKVNLFVWEADRVPTAWVESLEHGTHLVIVPSSFTREALVRSGFPGERVLVAPLGHDVEETPVEPYRGPGRPFTFLSIVSPHERKGIRELLRAYALAFRSGDGVLLRIKSTYDPGEARRRFPFEIGSWKEALDFCGLSAPGSPPVDLVVRTLDDAATLALYLESDVCVQPSWGESFGLAILDALASGVPAIATGWGGHMDFFPAGPDALPYVLREAGAALYEPAPGAHVAIPDVQALAERMRWHREHPAESRALGAAARRAVSKLTWQNAARKLLALLPWTGAVAETSS